MIQLWWQSHRPGYLRPPSQRSTVCGQQYPPNLASLLGKLFPQNNQTAWKGPLQKKIRNSQQIHEKVLVHYCCSVSVVSDSVTPWTVAHQDSLFFTIFQSSDSCPLSQWCHPTISSSVTTFSCLQSFPASGSFSMSHLFPSGAQSIGASALASVLPMNIHDWFPLGLIGLISLLSKELSTIFSSTTIQKHQLFGAQPSLWSNSHIVHDYWKNHSFDHTDLWWQSDVFAP